MVMEDLKRAEIEREPVTPVVWFMLVALIWAAFWGCSHRFGREPGCPLELGAGSVVFHSGRHVVRVAPVDGGIGHMGEFMGDLGEADGDRRNRLGQPIQVHSSVV